MFLLDPLDEAYELRSLLAHEVGRQLVPDLATVIAYVEVARSVTVEEAAEPGFDYVYGSNLQHALLMARAANRATGSSRIVLVTYNMPSAHHVHADVSFNYPPVPESLEAARREASGAASDGIRIDALLVVPDTTSDRAVALEDYFGPIAEGTGGEVFLVAPSDEVAASVDRLVTMTG
jgi:uncharacterized protein with von Willebrand factor type A (vWA) domain